MRRSELGRQRFLGTELRGKTLGIVGLGRIGAHVATLARAFGMPVLAYDPYVTEARARELQVELGPLDRLLARGGGVALHLPLTQETKSPIDRPRLGPL